MRGFMDRGTRSFRFGDVKAPANSNNPSSAGNASRSGLAGSRNS